MTTKVHWNFPVPSTCSLNKQIIQKDSDVFLLVDYYDYDASDDKTYIAGILFRNTLAHKFAQEMLHKSIGGSYDALIESLNSEWLTEFNAINKEFLHCCKLHHFSIYLDSAGLYEFIAEDFEILPIREGELKESEPWLDLKYWYPEAL